MKACNVLLKIADGDLGLFVHITSSILLEILLSSLQYNFLTLCCQHAIQEIIYKVVDHNWVHTKMLSYSKYDCKVNIK